MSNTTWRLTPKETDVLDLIVETGSGAQAAQRLGMKLGTVKAHMARIRLKMNVDSIVRAAVLWDRYSRETRA